MRAWLLSSTALLAVDVHLNANKRCFLCGIPMAQRKQRPTKVEAKTYSRLKPIWRIDSGYGKGDGGLKEGK